MGALHPIHVLWLISIVSLLYAGWMVWYFTRESRRMKKQGGEPSPEKKRKDDVIGKSLFVLPLRHSQPQTAIEGESIETNEKEHIFAESQVPGYPRQIPPEELDDVFGQVPVGETNDPLDIDYLSESEFTEEEEDNDNEFEDEYEDLPMGVRPRARGTSFEEMGEAYRQVVHTPEITDEQIEDTGRILLDLKHTDLFETMVSGKPEREDKVSYFIDTYLAAFHKRMPIGNEESQSLRGVAPAGFDIMDYIPQ